MEPKDIRSLIKQLSRIADALETANERDAVMRELIATRMQQSVPNDPTPKPANRPADWDRVRAAMPAHLRDELGV